MEIHNILPIIAKIDKIELDIAIFMEKISINNQNRPKCTISWSNLRFEMRLVNPKSNLFRTYKGYLENQNVPTFSSFTPS